MMAPLLVAISVCFPPIAPPLAMCSCLSPPVSDSTRAIAELRAAHVVFVGKATSVVDTTPPWGVRSLRATFIVQEGWKGPMGKSITVFTAADGVHCGFEFAVGTEYLVFAAVEPNGVVHTRSCAPTQPLATAREYLVGLGEPRIRYAPADSGSQSR